MRREIDEQIKEDQKNHRATKIDSSDSLLGLSRSPAARPVHPSWPAGSLSPGYFIISFLPLASMHDFNCFWGKQSLFPNFFDSKEQRLLFYVLGLLMVNGAETSTTLQGAVSVCVFRLMNAA
jgi:hypothetical protein